MYNNPLFGPILISILFPNKDKFLKGKLSLNGIYSPNGTRFCLSIIPAESPLVSNNIAELYNFLSRSKRSIPDKSSDLLSNIFLTISLNSFLVFGQIEGYAASGQIINDADVLFNLDKAYKLSICWSLYSGFHL